MTYHYHVWPAGPGSGSLGWASGSVGQALLLSGRPGGSRDAIHLWRPSSQLQMRAD